MKAGFILKLIASALIMSVGALMTIMGITDVFWCGKSYVSHEYYGGDAYTGIQNAAADTANNIGELGYLISDIANMAFFFVGLFLIGLGLFLLGKAIYGKALAKTVAAPAPQYQPPRY